MKTLLAATAAIALLAGAGAASAQMYQPVGPAMQPQPQPTYTSGTVMAAPPWMQDDGSSSDHPIHNPDDRSGDALNAQYSGGLTTAPGTGLPALPGQ